MSASVPVALAAELAKLLLVMYFEQARLAGMTQEQVDTLYMKRRDEFRLKDPANIPDPA
jgi:hypothetical protein